MSTVAKDARKHHRGQHEDCMTKYNEIQMDKKLRSAKLRTENKEQNVFDSERRSDFSFTVQKDTEVIHQRSRRKNEDQLLPERETVRILGNTSTEEFGEENTSEQRRLFADEAHARVYRRTDRPMCACHCRLWKRPPAVMKSVTT